MKQNTFALNAILVLFLILSGAGISFAKGRMIVVDVQDRPLAEVLKSISAQSDYRFVYNNNIIDVRKPVTASVSSEDINVVLAKVLYGTGITYTIVKQQVALLPDDDAVGDESKAEASGERTIHGIVLDSNGEVLPGADVFVDGTTNGAVTDINGHFTLIVPDDPGTVLVFNFIGMKQAKTNLGDQDVYEITLVNDSQYLEEVVVTGYQTISRERSAGSFAKVEGAQVQDKGNAHGSILRALEGTVAGLSVNTTASGTQYLIRGITSINSNTDPLYIVDGVPMSFSLVEKMVNPNDVANVSFLKDATAASIWGAQAANGVIVITTKTGTGNGRLNIDYSGTFTYKGKPNYSYLDRMSSADFISTAQEVFDPYTYKWDDINRTPYGTGSNYPIVLPHEEALYGYFRGTMPLAQRDLILNRLASTDGRAEYEKYFMSNAFLTNHSLSISGGNDRNTYYMSLEYQGDQGTDKSRTDDYRVNMRDVLNLTNWLKLDLSLTAYASKTTTHQPSYDEYGGDHLGTLPYISYYDADGNELSLSHYRMNADLQSKTEAVSGISLDYFPVTDYNNSIAKSLSYGVRANAGLTIDFLDCLSYEGRFQFMIDDSEGYRFYDQDTYKVRLDRTFATNKDGKQFLPSSGGEFTMADTRNLSYTVRNQISFDKEISAAQLHRVTALAGFELNSTKNLSHSSFRRGYDMQTMQYIFYDDYVLSQTGVQNPLLPMIAGASSNTFEPNAYEQGELEYRFVSIYANAAYTLMDKYSLNASIRVDQSNLFGSDPSVQFKPIWSVGGIWNIAKETFMGFSPKVNTLNLRLSFGYSGNSPRPGEGGPYDILSSISDPRFNRFGLGYTVATPANDKLTWEKTRTWNVGVDYAFFNHRLGGSIDFYDKYTTNLLAATMIDPTTGFTTVLTNIGTMLNRGVELSVSSTNIQRRDFSWNTDLSFTYNYNKLLSMYITPPGTPSSMVDYDYWEGYPYGTIFAYKWAGLDPSDGMPRVYDSKGNPVRTVAAIDSLDVVPYMGTTIPPFYGALTNSFRYKGFDLSFMFVFYAGHVMRNDVNTKFTGRLDTDLHNEFSQRWKKPGDELHTNVPAYYPLNNTSINEGDVIGLYRYADINVLDASYIKLRDISLSYNLPEQACRAMKARNASVRLQVSDIFVIPFNRHGIDPEAFYLSSGGRGDKFRPYFTVGLSLGF